MAEPTGVLPGAELGLQHQFAGRKIPAGEPGGFFSIIFKFQEFTRFDV